MTWAPVDRSSEASGRRDRAGDLRVQVVAAAVRSARAASAVRGEERVREDLGETGRRPFDRLAAARQGVDDRFGKIERLKTRRQLAPRVASVDEEGHIVRHS